MCKRDGLQVICWNIGKTQGRKGVEGRYREKASDVAEFVKAEDGIRDRVRSRGLGDVNKRQVQVGKDSTGQGLIAPASIQTARCTHRR